MMIDAQIKRLIVIAVDLWNGIFWPRYQPGRRVQKQAVPLRLGGLVIPAPEVDSLQTVQGLRISCDRLGPGVVCAVNADGEALIRWSNGGSETWAEQADLRLIDPGWCLVTIVRCDAHGHRTLLRRTIAPLQHHWTIELRPENVIRAARSDGLAWTFTRNPINQTVIASWLYPPEDDDAEALTAAELAAA